METEWKQRLMGYKQISNDQLLVIKPFTERPVKLALKIKGTKNKLQNVLYIVYLDIKWNCGPMKKEQRARKCIKIAPGRSCSREEETLSKIILLPVKDSVH